MDLEWRRLERAWQTEPDDQAALERAIAARRRHGVPVPVDMRERRIGPARTFSSRLQLRVWAVEPGGGTREVGRTGYSGRPVAVPAHRVWWVQPATRITDLELVAVLREVTAQGVPGLSLDGCPIEDASLRAIGVAAPLLRWLSLRDCARITDDGVAALANLAQLESLDLRGCIRVTDAAIDHLACLGELTRLDLSGCGQVTDAGLAALAALRDLSRLRLEGCHQVTDAGVDQLVSAAPRLEALDLAWCQRLTDHAVERLQRLPALSRLSVVGCTRLTDGALERLGRMEGLSALGLGPAPTIRITDAGLGHLAGLARLTQLELESCEGITDRGLEHLARLEELTALNLGGCSLLSDRGLELLSSHPRLARLRLWRCEQVTDVGLGHLARVRTLVDLDLSWCAEVTDSGLERLHALPALTRVNLQGCDRTTVAGRAALDDALRGCAVEV